MKISDRDKKLILFVLFAAIIALPIFLFIRPKNNQIKDMDAELESLNERYNYLKDLSDKQETYEQEIVRLNKERDGMILEFASDIKQENTVMMLRGIELSENPVITDSVDFGENTEEEVTEGSFDANGNYVEGLTAVKTQTQVVYHAPYTSIRPLLDYMFNYKDKMGISSFTMEVDPTTNFIKGTYVLDQYAITGTGKETQDIAIPSIPHGTDRLFYLYYDEEGNLIDENSAKGIKSEDDNQEDATE